MTSCLCYAKYFSVADFALMYLLAACYSACISSFHPSVVFVHRVGVCTLAQQSVCVHVCVFVHSVSLQSADKNIASSAVFSQCASLLSPALGISCHALLSYLSSSSVQPAVRLLCPTSLQLPPTPTPPPPFCQSLVSSMPLKNLLLPPSPHLCLCVCACVWNLKTSHCQTVTCFVRIRAFCLITQ